MRFLNFSDPNHNELLLWTDKQVIQIGLSPLNNKFQKQENQRYFHDC